MKSIWNTSENIYGYIFKVTVLVTEGTLVPMV